jgi:CheY-like chemotaxis protein
LNGFEFLKAYARQLRPHTPVILLSGQGNIQLHSLSSFVMAVLPKPFEIETLLQMTEKYAHRLLG